MTGTGADAGTGRMMPDFRLPALGGPAFEFSSLRHRRHAVLLFLGEPAALLGEALRPWQERRADFAAEETEVVAVVAGTEGAPRGAPAVLPPFPVLADGGGRLHRDVGAADDFGRPSAALFIVDRYGEIHHRVRARDGDGLPAPEAVLEWVRFIGSLCPE